MMIHTRVGLFTLAVIASIEQAATSNISFVGTSNSNGISVTIPDSIAGDLALLSALRVTDSTIPTIPSTTPPWSAPPDTDDIDISIAAATGGAFVRYKYPTVSGQASGDCTNSQGTMCGVYRGVHATTPILAMKFASGNGTNINFPALTYSSSTSWIVGGWRNAGVTAATPSGAMNNRVLASTRGWFDSEGPLSSFAGLTYTLPSAVNWVAWTLALQSA